ncbi:MAG: amino acid kinase family protein [Methylosarcina sp.]
MVIIKLGGSLAKTGGLSGCLDRIEQQYRGTAAVVVPGGGAFADQVRLAQEIWRFDDSVAHRMALLAMQQMALLFHGLKPQFAIAGSISAIKKQISRKNTVIWSPDAAELEQAGVKAGWDVTSDSLAAWLANTLSARELILVKSATIDAEHNLAELTRQHVVDQAFCDFVDGSTYKISIINRVDF